MNKPIDSKLEPLLADYICGSAGAAEVLGDALLERGVDPLPVIDDAGTRLERALALLAATRQAQIGCVNVRRMIDRFATELSTNKPLLINALSALEESSITPGAPPVADNIRQSAFKAWIACDKGKASLGAKRVAWAVWMLMRERPLDALRSLRAIDEGALPAQISLVASALGGSKIGG